MDAKIAVIPKADSEGQRPLSVLPVVYRLRASLEEVLSAVGGVQLHVMVADVIKSFDTVDRSIPDCTLGRLGLPGWFRKTYFAYHSQVRLWFKLSAGLGESRCWGIPQGCPLSMVFTVALYVTWCRYLESLTDVRPQHYADNLKCSAQCLQALFGAARFTAWYVRAVGQDVSPCKYVLLSTSKSVRKSLKHWDIFQGWSLDFTDGARAGALSCRVKEATAGVATVGALPLGFQVKLGLDRSKYIPAGLHAAEASYVSASSLGAFRAAVVGAVWSSKMPLANTPAVRSVLDGPVGVDPALHVSWVRFRMMSR